MWAETRRGVARQRAVRASRRLLEVKGVEPVMVDVVDGKGACL